MDHKQTLKNYATAQLASGATAESIKQQLVTRGWDEALVDTALSEVAASAARPQAIVEAAESTQPLATKRVALQPINNDVVAEPVARQHGGYDNNHSPAVSAVEIEDNLVNATDSGTVAGASLQMGAVASLPADQRDTGHSQPSDYYTVRQAVSEALDAVAANRLAVGVTALIGLVLVTVAYAVAIIGGIMLVFSASISMSFNPTANILMSTGIWAGLLVLVVLLALAIAQSLVGVAIDQGAQGMKSTLGRVIKTATARVGRVMFAMLLYGLLIILPQILVGGSAFAISSLLADTPAPLMIVFFMAIPIALALSIIVALRLAIMPIVALLEPHTPLLAVYRRTNQLMKGGSWFVFKCFVLIAVINSIISGLISQLASTIDVPAVLATIYALLAAFAYVLYNAVLVVFYRNRRAVKD